MCGAKESIARLGEGAAGAVITRLHIALRQRTEGPASSHSYRAVLQKRVMLHIVGSNTLLTLWSLQLGISFAIYATEAMGASLWSVGVVGVFQTGFVAALEAMIIWRARSYCLPG